MAKELEHVDKRQSGILVLMTTLPSDTVLDNSQDLLFIFDVVKLNAVEPPTGSHSFYQ